MTRLELVLVIISAVSLILTFIVMNIAWKTLHAQNDVIKKLRYEKETSERSLDIYKVAYETLVDNFIHNEKPSIPPTCENCWWYYRNPIGGNTYCKYRETPSEEVCEHYIKN